MAATAAAEEPPVYGFHLPLRTERDLRLFIREAWGLRIPDHQVCENHTTPWRAFADAYFARSPMSVWKGSRGLAGKTVLLGSLSLTEAVTLDANVNLLGGSGTQSQRVLEAMDRFWRHPGAPTGMLKSAPAQHHTILKDPKDPTQDGARINALMASSKAVRGPHPHRLRLDEIDEMDIEILNASLGQPMDDPIAGPTGKGLKQQTVFSSTHQHAFGTMTEILRRAASLGWPVYEWCYRETLEPHGWLRQDEVDKKRSLLPPAMFAAEIELQEPSPQDRYIHPEKVKRMFRREMGRCAGEQGQYYEFAPPRKGCVYATGADWARNVDWTVVVTMRIDCNPARVVAFYRDGRVPYPEMVKNFHYQQQRFGSFACHDKSGVGVAVHDFLTIPAEGVTLVGKTRADLFVEYRDAIEREELISPFIEYMETEHRLAGREDIFKSGDEHHPPDSVVAGALAWKASALRQGPSIY